MPVRGQPNEPGEAAVSTAGPTGDPGTTAEPSKPAEPSEPTEPSKPAEPSEPTGPTGPDGPDGPAEPAEPAGGGTGRRRPRLVLPVTILLALLAAAGVAGRYLVPPDQAESSQPAPGPVARPPRPSPTLPELPSPPTLPPRPADALAGWAGEVSRVLGIPAVAVQAYGYAQLDLQRTDGQCHLGWTTLAGVGQVESAHGQVGGAQLRTSGRSSPPVIGPPLDGRQGRALVRDTDIGAFDGDSGYDRAMGPLGLLPSEWRANAADADGDGVLDPYDIDDAALALARLLCAGPEDLDQLAGWRTALARHRTGKAYADSVFAVANDYGQRTQEIE